MKQYQDLLESVYYAGEQRMDRTGVGTLSSFDQTLKIYNGAEFPAVTLKKLAFKQVCSELACFIRGYTLVDDFHRMGCTIWDANAAGRSDLGPIYGAQWRNWNGIDQLKNLVNSLQFDPTGRRHIVSAWNVGQLSEMSLPPCPIMFQCYVREKRALDMTVYQRSADLFLGLPFDIASYAILQRLLAIETGLQPGWLNFHIGDAHIYNNHKQQVSTLLDREPISPPLIQFHPEVSLFDFTPEQAWLINYRHHGIVNGVLNV